MPAGVAAVHLLRVPAVERFPFRQAESQVFAVAFVTAIRGLFVHIWCVPGRVQLEFAVTAEVFHLILGSFLRTTLRIIIILCAPCCECQAHSYHAAQEVVYLARWAGL